LRLPCAQMVMVEVSTVVREAAANRLSFRQYGPL
jgi:hypothetical protein